MQDLGPSRAFPTDDSLCERCGYPLRGLTVDALCPECGLAVSESSPGKRVATPIFGLISVGTFFKTFALYFFHAPAAFRRMAIDGDNEPARVFLLWSSMLAIAWFIAISAAWLVLVEDPSLDNNVLGFIVVLQLIGVLIILALTYIEMLGVTAFSKRRGWRVPFHLAERVCCYASVGWLPGVMLAGLGVWVLQSFAVGRPWFEQYLGLVKVGWLCYGGLFVLSLLWFETLVWVGVRQVKYANAWPGKARDDSPIPL